MHLFDPEFLETLPDRPSDETINELTKIDVMTLIELSNRGQFTIPMHIVDSRDAVDIQNAFAVKMVDPQWQTPLDDRPYDQWRAFVLQTILAQWSIDLEESTGVTGKVFASAKLENSQIDAAIFASDIYRLRLSAKLGELGVENIPIYIDELATVSVTLLSTLLQISGQTLQSWRIAKIGPPWVQVGGRRSTILYPLVELRAWLESHRGE